MRKLTMILPALLAVSPALAESDAAGLSAMPLLTKGLIVTAGGLGGVFLVLLLFFLIIKVMGKMK